MENHNDFLLIDFNITGECWSGDEVGNSYKRAGQVETCTTLGYKRCPADPNANEIECVGNKETNYVYEISDLS